MGYLIDTCVWIDVEQGRLAPGDVASVTRDEPVYLSPVTVAELKYGAEAARDPAVRQRRLASLRRLLGKPSLPIDLGTAEVFGSVAAAIRAAGRGHRYRVQDLWLASQAIQHGLGLLTLNVQDFEDVPGLELVRMPQPQT